MLNPINHKTKQSILEKLNQISHCCDSLDSEKLTHTELTILNGYALEIKTIQDAISSIKFSLSDDHYEEQLEEGKI